jgi:hypothetical protein
MGLVAEVELELRDAGLIDFFLLHKPAFKAMAETAYHYTKTYVQPTGIPVRRDDVAGSLVSALETNEKLRDFLASHRLRQKYQYRRFADLILDRLWEELER